MSPRTINRLVIKIGSGIVAPHGVLDDQAIRRLAGEVAAVAADVGVVLVSSGAVAGGFRSLGFAAMPTTIVAKQAAAAVGQQRLMQRWAAAFAPHDLEVAQILLTADDLHHRARFLNARHTVQALLSAGIVPIVNENDTVSYDEIKLGDNDHLSALVADLVDADLLLLLTVARGVCEGGADGRVIEVINDPEAAVVNATATRTPTGIGGMVTKIRAAGLAAASGRRAIIADGREAGLVAATLRGEQVGTLFPARVEAVAARKRWIGLSARPKGRLTIDSGALDALRRRGASLLPSGITGVTGAFEAGDTIEVAGPDGRTIARGIVSYGAKNVAAIKGLRTDKIAETLGYLLCDEVIHRNDLAMLEGGAS